MYLYFFIVTYKPINKSIHADQNITVAGSGNNDTATSTTIT